MLGCKIKSKKMGLPHFFCVKILGLFGIVFKKMGASILLFDKINSNFFANKPIRQYWQDNLGRLIFCLMCFDNVILAFNK